MAAAASWKIHKWAYLGQFLTDLHQMFYADRCGQYKDHRVKNSTSWKFKMVAVEILKKAYLGQYGFCFQKKCIINYLKTV